MNSFTVEKKSSVSGINQELKSGTSASYPFVDLIRFISMMGIVWAHIDVYSPNNVQIPDVAFGDGYMQYFIPFKQLFKFGVICFFMISGFLLSDKIDHTNSLTYFKKRLRSTFKPYVVAVLLFFAVIFARAYIFHRAITPVDSFFSLIKFTIQETTYWYLPNYLISLIIILALKKYIRSWYLGIAMFMVTIIYTILNVYTAKYAQGHASALLGYIFYLWLGAYIRQNNLVSKIQSINSMLLLTVTIALFILSSVEAYWLYKKGLIFFHILRGFNQLYSVAMFMLLVNLCKNKVKFGFFNPRKETFGIYLYHAFFTFFLIPKFLVSCRRYLGIDIYSNEVAIRLLLMTVYWAVCYILTTLLVKLLLKFKLAYL